METKIFRLILTSQIVTSKRQDKAYFKNFGLPTVADARLAVADSAQLGMDWGTMGYRFFEPDVSRGIIETTPQMHTTYDSGVGKVGQAMTMLDESRGVPANLLMRDFNTLFSFFKL